MKGVALSLLMLTLLGCKDDEVPTDDSVAPTDDSAVETVDADGDGFDADADCDDDDPEVNPDAEELCDGVDNDCDGATDDADDDVADQSAWYTDADGDGYGDDATELMACEAPEGAVAEGGDCDDGDEAFSPGADETCDGVDNDCDDLVDDADDDITDASTWWTDADFDGYGDPNAPIVACTGPSGAVANDQDCDDTEYEINPDASEACDGIDNDCDPSTSEAGWVRYYDESRNDTEITDQFNGGTASNPYVFSPSRAGTLYICEGTFYAQIDANVDMVIIGTSGAAQTTLDSGGGSAVVVDVGGVSVQVEGLTLTGGQGSGNYFGYSMGGGVRCDGSSTVDLTDVHIYGNSAGLGGGVHAEGCGVTAVDSVIEGNSSVLLGGGVNVLDGLFRAENTEISGNTSANGGGLSAGQLGYLELVDSLVVDNEADSLGGGVYQDAGTTLCSGGASVDAGIYRNTAASGGGVYLNHVNSAFDAVSCDMGSDSDENRPDDVAGSDDGSLTAFGADETFSCTAEGCN